MNSFSVSGNFVDVHQEKIYPATVAVENGRILSVTPLPQANGQPQSYILPGFIDSHVHIESSMLVPSEFARLAVVHGTVGTVSDPHEIANVCGLQGVEFMIENGKTVPFKFNFGAPSCVPATVFETAGATLDSADVEKLLQRDDIKYLSEMMNFPGVLFKDEEVMKKIAAAHRMGKPVDGHAPGLRGEKAKQYIEASQNPSEEGALVSNTNNTTSKPKDSKNPPSEGREVIISTDHECFTKEEALDKLQYGMKIIIREGSAAKNFEALIDLLNDWPDMMMFCSDDKHPDSLVLGHINQLCARAVKKGIDIYKVLKAACVNPVNHYKLDVGLLREGDPADFILVNDLENFEVTKTYINGELVAEDGKSLVISQQSGIINNFSCISTSISDYALAWDGKKENPVIEALDGQLITNKLFAEPRIVNGNIEADVERDILKLVVVNRYSNAPVAATLIKNFGLKKGALASSVAHDSHNIVAVGADDESICRAVNFIIANKGGISCVCPAEPEGSRTEMALPLPVAGLMSNEDGYMIAARYEQLDKMAKEELGSTLASPYMTLSFMALLVIPHLKLSDKGLFDGDSFSFVNQVK